MNLKLPQETIIVLGLIALGFILLVAIADAILLLAMIRDTRREPPLLARRWSVAHVFLALQAWIAITLVVAIPVMWFAAQRTGPSQAWSMLPILVIQNAAMIGIVLVLVLDVYREPLRSAGLVGWDWRRHAMLGLGAALIAIPVNDLLERLLSLTAARTLSPGTLASLTAFQQMVSVHEHLIKPLHTPLGLAALIAVIGLIGPLGEEVFFRGLAQTALRRRLGALWAIIGSAAFFAIIHLNPIGLLPIFLMGLLLGALYQRTGSLAAPFVLHAANNTAAVLVAYFHPEFTFWPFIPAR
jgi:membrane protease YdiL (CAAX protease family)